ncbi:MAG: N-acetyl sugar amidotransferase [Bdellovibrionales bacterium]|nr:N-acetyl sugar amidotransferase [Bdellovibrionales bacterium]
MRYCSLCVYPAVAATPLTFDQNGVCSGCIAARQKQTIDWQRRESLFEKLVDEYRGTSNYDCILPVSGGKDSYFAAHVCKQYGLKGLMVTYHGNNYLPEGEANLQRMRDVFRFDHCIFHPATDTLVKMNRLGFKITGDMNWHNHAGIFTYPMQVAVKERVPLVFWGDHGFTEMGGMFSYNDFFEYTAKDRYEHALHGFDWFDFVEDSEKLTQRDLSFMVYPTDEAILSVGVRGIYLSNYFPYDGVHHADIAKTLYGWEEARQPFERTFRTISNLDDMHENGVHDYLKFIKLGYGRGTDHALYEIRAGRMTRQEGIEMVRRYDHVKPSDLERWLAYTGMTESEFDSIADTFRDQRVWRIEDNQWVKDTVWGESVAYGKVCGLPGWAR